MQKWLAVGVARWFNVKGRSTPEGEHQSGCREQDRRHNEGKIIGNLCVLIKSKKQSMSTSALLVKREASLIGHYPLIPIERLLATNKKKVSQGFPFS